MGDCVQRSRPTFLRSDVPGRVVFHADRGTQYTSEQLRKVILWLNIDQSMGRTGVCFDNAMAESFWSTLKNQFYHRFAWPIRADARQGVARWIEVIYNRRRRHSSIGYLRPVEFADRLISQEQADQQPQAA